MYAFVAGHNLGDIQTGGVGEAERGVHRGHACAGIGKTRRRRGKDLEAAVALLVASPRGIRREQVISHHIDHAPLNIGEDDRFAVGAELEVGVRPAAFRGGAILLGSENDEIAVRRDGAALRETPLDQLIRAVAERVVG